MNDMEMYKDDLPSDDGYDYENIVTSQELAEKQFRCLKYWQEEERMIIEHFHKELDRITLWKEHKINRINKKKQWHEHGLHTYLEQNKKKKIDLVHGTISKSKGREKIDIPDREKFDEWFLQESDKPLADFYITKTEPSKDLIKKYIKATGEIPEGCLLHRSPDKIKVTIKEDQVVTALGKDVTEGMRITNLEILNSDGTTVEENYEYEQVKEEEEPRSDQDITFT